MRTVIYSFTTTRGLAGENGVPWRCAGTAARWRRSRGGRAKKRRGRTTRKLRLLFLRLDVFRRLIFAPRIVGVSKHQTLGEWRVRIHPKRNERRRIRIGEIDFAHRLERVSGHLRRIRHNAVSEFESKNVGVVFLHSAVAVNDGRRDKHYSFEDE